MDKKNVVKGQATLVSGKCDLDHLENQLVQERDLEYAHEKCFEEHQTTVVKKHERTVEELESQRAKYQVDLHVVALQKSSNGRVLNRHRTSVELEETWNTQRHEELNVQ
jgi:hypothetical protein